MKLNIILAIGSIVLLIGCATTRFEVNVDSISAPQSGGKMKYMLLPGLKDVEVTDLQFMEYARYINKALTLKGFVKTDEFQEANMAIYIAYGIGDPQINQYTYSLPVIGQTGVLSSTTSGTINSYGGYGTFQGTTIYTPTYGITGYSTRSGTYTTYFRYLVLDAVDLDEYRKSQKTVQLWKTTVTSTGSTGDLRRVFPVLVGASKSYLGSNTGKMVTIKLSEDDKTIREIREVANQK